jgi:hypothetical protein
MFIGVALPNISPELLITSGILATATAAAMQLKALPGKLFTKLKSRCMYTAKIYQYDELFYMFEEWLYKHHTSMYRNVEAMVGDPQYLQGVKTWNADNEQGIKYFQEANVVLVKYNGKRLIVDKNKQKVDKPTSMKDQFFRSYTVSGLFAKQVIDELFKEAKREYEDRRKEVAISVYAPASFGDWEHVTDIGFKKLDSVILNKDLKRKIISDIDEFTKSKSWYESLGIPYRRAYCFHGLPGNGKTSLAKAIASHTERDIYTIQINSMDGDTALRRAFSHVKEDSILLIEDIDKAYSGRDAKDHKVSFSTLLNCLDGVLSKEGIITIITTNHLDQLDPALIRAGRTDMIEEILNPGLQEVNEYVNRFFAPPENCEILVAVPNRSLSMSTIQEICIQNKKDPIAAVNEMLRRYNENENIVPVENNK